MRRRESGLAVDGHVSAGGRLVRTITSVAALSLPIALLGAGCGGDSAGDAQAGSTQAAASGSTVTIVDFEFQPEAITVPAGTDLEFVNDGPANHTATEASDPPVFDTEILEKGDSATVALEEPGTYSYICALHPFMNGTVTVE